MIDLATMGVTDEAVAIRATADYFVVAPKDQRLAEGDDGVFLSSARWALSSASCDFAASGIAPGSMVQLDFARVGVGTSGKPATRDRFDQLAVSSVATSPPGLVLRRKGSDASGIGSPPGPSIGATGVKFTCLTVQPQVRDASRRIALRYRIAAAAQVHTPDDFANAVVCSVLCDLYFAQARMAGEDAADDFIAKAKMLAAEFKSITENLDDRYNQTPDGGGLVLGSIPGGRRRPTWRDEC